MKSIQVAVGVIKRNDKFYISKRADHLHQGGKWEFPGGKLEEGETALQALKRELHEEVCIEVNSAEPLLTIEHDYGDKKVTLLVQITEDFRGEPRQQEGQIGRWVSIRDLREYDFPEANQGIIERLFQ